VYICQKACKFFGSKCIKKRSAIFDVACPEFFYDNKNAKSPACS